MLVLTELIYHRIVRGVDFFLKQHVREATRGIYGSRVLDLVLTNYTDMVEHLEHRSHLGNSDYVVLVRDLCCDTVRDNFNQTYYCFNKGYYDGLRSYIKERIDQIHFTHLPVNEIWNILMDLFNDVIKRFVPVMSGEKKHKNPLLLTKQVTRSI